MQASMIQALSRVLMREVQNTCKFWMTQTQAETIVRALLGELVSGYFNTEVVQSERSKIPQRACDAKP